MPTQFEPAVYSLPALLVDTVHLADLKNDRYPDGLPSVGKRALIALVRFLIIFCVGVSTTLAWQSYGDATRQMIANSHPQFGWLAPRHAATVQKAPDAIGPAASAAPYPDRQQFDTMLRDIQSMRESIDRVAAGQEQITRSIDEIATRIAAGQEQMTRRTDQTANSITAGQEPTTRSSNQTAATIATGQEEMTRNTDQTPTNIDQAPSKAISIPVASRGEAASSPPTVRSNIKPTEAKPPQTLSEKGKPLYAASGHDPSCFPSASAVLENHPGGWPTWTLRASGHEGTMCWYAAARPRGSDHRPTASRHREMMPAEKETVGTAENGLSAPFAPYGRGGSWEGGLPY